MHTLTTFSIIIVAAIIGGLLLVILWLLARTRKITKALHDSNEMLQHQDAKRKTIIEALPVGVEVYSPEGLIISLNNRDCEIFGVDRGAVLKGNITISENPNLPDNVKQAFTRGEKVTANFPYDFTIVNETGFYKTKQTTKIKRISCNGTPVMDKNNKMLNYVFIVDDITEQYNQNRKWEDSIRLSDQAIQAVDMVLWKYDGHTHLFSAYNEPLNNYERDTKISIERYLTFIHPEDARQLLEITTLMNKGVDESFEYDLRLRPSPNEKWQYCTVSGTPFIRDENGKVTMYTGFRRDNTKWKELNDNLLSMNIQNELILNNTSSGLAFISTDFMVEWENISICSSNLPENAYRKAEKCYKSTYGRTSPCEDCVMLRAMESKLTEKKVIVLENRSSEVFATPIMNSDGTVNGVVIRLDDITERQQMIAELHIAKEHAVQSDKLKSAFLANMSHEIRTPLNAIVGFADLLISTDDEAEKAEYSKIIATNNDLLLRLINDILNLSKIEAEFVDRKVEEFDLSLYFNELCSSLRQRMNNPNIRFIQENPYAHCLVNLDKNRIAQIMLNYATNSIKYTSKGFIQMGYEHLDNGIRFYVSDSGIGIPDEKKHLVYQRFEKLDEFAQGTGLGLSICKAISEAGGGKVGFESEEGVGSTFWSWIPCSPIIDEGQCESRVVADEVKPNVSDDVPKPSGELEKRLLIAEDIASNYRLLHAILHKNYDLTWVQNGQEAVEKMHSEHFDLVLMDMKMPIMGGLEATERIREFDPTTPIIALTAHAFETDREAAFASGCNDHLVKPINKRLLFTALEKWM